MQKKLDKDEIIDANRSLVPMKREHSTQPHLSIVLIGT